MIRRALQILGFASFFILAWLFVWNKVDATFVNVLLLFLFLAIGICSSLVSSSKVTNDPK